MKKVLFATTALVMTAGVAAAEVSVGGDGRMGLTSQGGDDLGFTSRIRISFSASGETDAGLSFGGSIRADNAADEGTDTDASGDFDTHAGGGVNGAAGSVFIEGSFGKITAGDVSGAPEAAVGDLSGVGLTGNGDFNEFVYLSNSDRSAVRWDYTTGDLGLHVSSDNIGVDDAAYGVAVTYAMGDISFGLGHENGNFDGTTDIGHTVAGVTAGFGDATVKVAYGDASDLDFTQMGVSVDYVTGPTTLTAFYRSVEVGALDGDVYGIGVAYDLGGGASIKAGFADGDDVSPTGAFGTSLTDANYDFGISMSF